MAGVGPRRPLSTVLRTVCGLVGPHPTVQFYVVRTRPASPTKHIARSRGGTAASPSRRIPVRCQWQPVLSTSPWEPAERVEYVRELARKGDLAELSRALLLAKDPRHEGCCLAWHRRRHMVRGVGNRFWRRWRISSGPAASRTSSGRAARLCWTPTGTCPTRSSASSGAPHWSTTGPRSVRHRCSPVFAGPYSTRVSYGPMPYSPTCLRSTSPGPISSTTPCSHRWRVPPAHRTAGHWP